MNSHANTLGAGMRYRLRGQLPNWVHRAVRSEFGGVATDRHPIALRYSVEDDLGSTFND